VASAFNQFHIGFFDVKSNRNTLTTLATIVVK